MSRTLCAILTPTIGGHDWYESVVNSPYMRESDNSHWRLCWLRDEDVSDDWDTGYISPSTGLLTVADPGGDSIEVKLKVEVDGVLANTEPTGRTKGDGPIV